MVEYASGLTVFCQSSEIAQLVEVLALTSTLPVFWCFELVRVSSKHLEHSQS